MNILSVEIFQSLLPTFLILKNLQHLNYREKEWKLHLVRLALSLTSTFSISLFTSTAYTEVFPHKFWNLWLLFFNTTFITCLFYYIFKGSCFLGFWRSLNFLLIKGVFNITLNEWLYGFFFAKVKLLNELTFGSCYLL